MSIELEDFYQEFFQDVCSSADAEGQYAEDAFFELFCNHLTDAGELETADRAPYFSPRGLRIDGYGGDPASSGGILSLIIADFNQTTQIETLTASNMNVILKRATNFLTKSLDSHFRMNLEETAPAFGLADLIAARWSETVKVRVLLITNRRLSARIDGHDAGEVAGVPVTYGVWDIARLHRFISAGHEREDIEINLEEDYGRGLPALPAHLTEAGYEAYLVVIPGEQLATIYDRWGARLLEQNVRVFLQARGKINKGIRITLENAPEMFFAYNNGITATAESVSTRQTPNGLIITSLKNLQIVNGGQTTASIHTASRKKECDLSKVFVQMKLSIIGPSQSLEVVPKISEYANSQNRVSAADFFANHPFHVRIEDFSRRIYVPSPDGTFRESKWFYERARGQYRDAQANLTKKQQGIFKLEYPKQQMFTKTDLAKYIMLWRGFPDTVSKGAQKNFAEFSAVIGKDWSKQADAFNEMFYKHLIAKAIIFKRAEKLVTEQPWYEGGYRANIVAYAIAKIGHDVRQRELAVDFDRIWREQSISKSMKEALILSSLSANDILTDPPSGIRNVTEWAKKRACWTRIKECIIKWPAEWIGELISAEEHRESQKTAVKDQRMLNGIEAQAAIINAGSEIWNSVMEWGLSRKLLTPTELGVLELASSVPYKVPSEKQSIKAIQALEKLQAEGCQISLGF